MTTLNLSLSSPTTSSGYGSEEDHSPIFHFPVVPGGAGATDRCPASPSSDHVTSRVSGSKFNELEDDDDDDDINIDVFGEICGYLELDEEEDLMSNDCVEIPRSISSAEDRKPARELKGEKSICLPRGTGLSGENKKTRHEIVSLTTEAGDNCDADGFSVTPQNSITIKCSNRTAPKLSINSSREEISDDIMLETSDECTTEPSRWSEYSKSITPEPNRHISSSTIRDEENQTKPRHQSRQNSIRLAVGKQRQKPVDQNEAPPASPPPDKRRSGCRRTHHELDDHGYFSPAPQNEDQLPVPVKVPKTSLHSTGSGITGSGSNRRSEKSILETFLLTKEALNANKGSDGMLAEDNIARLYTGHQDSSRTTSSSSFYSSSSSSSSSSTSVLKRILIGANRNPPDAFATEQCSSPPIDSPDGDKETAVAPPIELDINYEIFNDNNCKYDSNTILLEFLCEKLDDEVWTPSGDSGKVFSNEMDAIINSQTSNNQSDDVWIHQYITDLL